MPLKINVKSGEKFVVNGAVMVAGSKGASLVLASRARSHRLQSAPTEPSASWNDGPELSRVRSTLKSTTPPPPPPLPPVPLTDNKGLRTRVHIQ